MKLPLSWIREWVDVPWDTRELASRLTMAGFEIEAIDTTADGDEVLEINVTPNRGDAMSVLGIARELAALSGKPVESAKVERGSRAAATRAAGDVVEVRLEAPRACPKFVGQIVRGLNNQAAVPAWLQSRLRACGVRSISPIVDVTNYVLLELGQPMHAYDLRALQGAITARFARDGETLTLLDAREVKLSADMLVIADAKGAVGLAGIMGGERTAVTAATTDVFLEVAWFEPGAIAGRARRLGLQTDASQRFERGVDPDGQHRAMDRATELLIEIAGGTASGSVSTIVADAQPTRAPVKLELSELTRTLGISIEANRVDSAFRALQLSFSRKGEAWTVAPPSHRFDLAISADLVEEVARIIGFDAIPEEYAAAEQRFGRLPEEIPSERAYLEALANRGYQEAITLAFVDPQLQRRMFPDVHALPLANPISTDLSEMRVSLWPGLVRAAAENLRRQQDRVRLFEHGVKFLASTGPAASNATVIPPAAATSVCSGVVEVEVVGGVCAGLRQAEQWGLKREAFDFFDIKGDVEALLAATGNAPDFSFEPAAHSALYPGRSARIVRAGQPVGWVGELHPALVRTLDLPHPLFVFEIEVKAGLASSVPAGAEVSRFPQVRRDLAIVLDESVTFSTLRERVVLASPDALKAVRVFDVYTGKSVEKGRKSIALGLIYQDFSRTLTDEETDAAVASVASALALDLNARIRE